MFLQLANAESKLLGQENCERRWSRREKIRLGNFTVLAECVLGSVLLLEPGKKLVYRLAHEKENILVTADVVRREKISTPAGDFNAIVLKPHIEIGGVFKPIGDIFLWLTDDDRHFILRIESKIKIGTIVAEIKSLDKGQDVVPGASSEVPDSVPEKPKPDAH